MFAWFDDRYVEALDEPGSLQRRIDQLGRLRLVVLLGVPAWFALTIWLDSGANEPQTGPAEPDWMPWLYGLAWIVYLHGVTTRRRVLLLMRRLRDDIASPRIPVERAPEESLARSTSPAPVES